MDHVGHDHVDMVSGDIFFDKGTDIVKKMSHQVPGGWDVKMQFFDTFSR